MIRTAAGGGCFGGNAVSVCQPPIPSSMPVRIISPVAGGSTICNGGQPPVGAPGSHPHHPRPGSGPMCPLVPHMHGDPFYCSPFGNPYYRPSGVRPYPTADRTQLRAAPGWPTYGVGGPVDPAPAGGSHPAAIPSPLESVNSPAVSGAPPLALIKYENGTRTGGSLPVPRRHTPYFGQPDYRIYELNKRLQQRTEVVDNLWWDAFATEFFEDDASLTLAFCLEDGPKRYTIGRTLIPRYFRSIFEGGVTELYYNMKHPKESFHNTSITLDCDQCTMITHHGKPLFTKVCTEGRLILEFTFDDLMRIKSWHFAVRTHRELIPRSVVGMHSQQDPGMLDQLSKNITRQGITNSTLNYLRLCVILEPMQELMSRHKAYALSPRDCLKTTLFQKWQRMIAPPGKRESQRPANKRRKRKGSNSGGAANNATPAPNKKRSPGPNFSLASQDVMVVGEPSLMGGEFGDEDERLITRLENTQYDAANSMDHDNHGFHADSPMPGSNSWGAGVGDRGPGVGPSQGNTPSNQDSDKKSPAVSQ
ncbi:hypothetical protein NQ317_014332 [Molorchus minor]|uniref:LIM interaction domain-containing protein n=1 Tax=Molorchus minor TaxID=1323400 RepID=A0ABQ9JXH2_9CUCU|nr:hypothetical protein NQ317_014332 [Molorchus minor]